MAKAQHPQFVFAAALATLLPSLRNAARALAALSFPSAVFVYLLAKIFWAEIS